MVEASGSNRGITPSMRKGIKRKVVRYNTNDGLSRDTFHTKKTPINAKENYGLITKARILDIQHYLGDEWIDYEAIRGRGAVQGVAMQSTSTSVYRCGKCFKPYQTGVDYTSRKGKGNAYVNGVVFINVPLERKECGLCE
jgi:hypothetical protein|tara:strand:- start:372 stop:791 length:420 start_codon:yes stop_codon:yes gene_type:complete